MERFVPVQSGGATIYTCGPTVYRYAHIGNLRSYLMSDWLRRLLEAQGYRVTHVKNITDVGHMRQDMLERGEDKVLAAALASGRTPQEIARFYTDAFLEDERKLNILPAHQFPRATDNIKEMVDITTTLVNQGHAYVVEGNVYFEVAKFADYGKLSGQRGTGLEAGVRVETDPLKRDPRDFALWKAAEAGRDLKWPSPWGEGFPGWHIECSAMGERYLGRLIDFHTGGVDNIFPAPRGRDRAERMRIRGTARPQLDARPAPAGGWPEDGEEHRQRVHRVRPRAPRLRSAGVPLPLRHRSLPFSAQLYVDILARGANGTGAAEAEPS